jgi:hypothetical protein
MNPVVTSAEEINKIRNIPMVFVVGCGRSGTTLLQYLLNSHPNIIAPPECAFILLLHPRFGKIKHWTKKDVLEFVKALFSIQNFALWLMNKEELTEELISVMEYADYALICRMVFYQMRGKKENVQVIIDKNPVYSLFIPKLLRLYPGAKIIHIIREPKDCVSAHLKRLIERNVFYTAWYWLGFNNSIEKAKQKSPGIFLTILYEDLVKNAEQTMTKLCAFINVPFDINVLQNPFPERLPLYSENKTFERIKVVHEGLLSPINDSNIGKWKKDMNKRDAAITDLITGNYAVSKYGYNREGITQEDRNSIPDLKLIKSKLQYYTWEYFTKLRFRNYTFNMYCRRKYKQL